MQIDNNAKKSFRSCLHYLQSIVAVLKDHYWASSCWTVYMVTTERLYYCWYCCLFELSHCLYFWYLTCIHAVWPISSSLRKYMYISWAMEKLEQSLYVTKYSRTQFMVTWINWLQLSQRAITLQWHNWPRQKVYSAQVPMCMK